MENKLRLAIQVLENKINETEKKYSVLKKGNPKKEKMSNYVNLKLKKEIRFLIGVNMLPSATILCETKSLNTN